jgi:FkbM family methyltransferase
MTLDHWPLRRGLDPYARLAGLISGPEASIVDGGANKGRTVDAFLALYPAAEIWAFEPIEELARKLSKRLAHNPLVRVRQAALGAGPGRLVLNVLQSRTCSSLLRPAAIREKHSGKPMDVALRREVPVVRLDQELSSPPDIIKLDLQGYELEALRGALGLLGGVRAILVEVSFKALYEGQPLASEVRQWLADRGFALEGLYAPWMDDLGRLVSGDALFVR